MGRILQVRGLLAVVAGGLAVASLAAPASAAPAAAHYSAALAGPAAPAARAASSKLPLSASRLAADERSHQAVSHQTTTITGLVRNAAGTPLSGICVAAFGAGDHRLGFTRADGRYVISGLRAGSYSLEYRECGGSAGYLTQWSGGALSQQAAAQLQIGGELIQPVATVTLRTFEQHAATRTAARPATSPAAVARHLLGLPGAAAATEVMTGRGRVAGKVTDRTGQPVKGICVEAASLRNGAFAITTKTGSYKTGKLPAGRYAVVFMPGCGSKGNWVGQFYKDSEKPTHPNVTVTAGHTTTGINGKLRPGGEISGVVTGTSGKKLSNVCVAPVSVSHKPVYIFASVGLSLRGTYHVHNLPPGQYRVQFSPCSDSSPYLPIWWRSSTTKSGAKLVTVQASHPVSGIDQELPVGGKITGTVTDAASTPLSGICVLAQGGKSTGYAGFGTQTGTDGSYAVEGLQTGTYQIQLQTGCGNNGDYVATSTPANIAVTDGQTTAGVDVVMKSGAVISGTVTNSAAQPVEGICVLIIGGKYDQYGGFVKTTSAGTYSLQQVPAANYTAQFSGGCGNTASYAPQAWDNTNMNTPTTIPVATGQAVSGIDAVMQPGATIAGRVTNSAGLGLRNACVIAGPSALLQETGAGVYDGLVLSGRGGTYREANLPAGQDDVVFADCAQRGPEYADQWYRAKPDPSGASAVWAGAGMTTSGINAALQAGGGLRGPIRTAAGRHPSGVCLDATDVRTGYQEPGFGVLFVGGTINNYTFSRVQPGPYQIVFGGNCVGLNYATQWYRDSATERGATNVMVRANHTTTGIGSALVKGGTISGHVTAAGTSTVLKNICVFAQDPSQYFFYGFGQTNKQGFYRVVGLNTGSYELSFSPCYSGGADNAASLLLAKMVHVRTGHPTSDVNAALTPGGTITGKVTGGSPAAGLANICVEAAGGNIAATDYGTTAADGSYELQNLPAGAYRVQFTAEPYCDDSGLFAPQDYSTPVTVTAGSTTSGVDVTLDNDGTISGTVTGQAGAKLTGVCVTAFGPTGPVVATTSAGGYSIGSLVPGRYVVQFSAGCGSAGLRSQWWQHAATRSKAKAIQITAGASITGINASMRK